MKNIEFSKHSIDHFIDEIWSTHGLSENTLNSYRSDIKNFLTDCKSSELSEIKDIGFEKKYNPFFRIDEFSFLDLLKTSDKFSDLNMEDRFNLLRDMRDEW